MAEEFSKPQQHQQPKKKVKNTAKAIKDKK